MLINFLSIATILFPALALANYANDCDPLNTTCSADRALGTAIKLDFSTATTYFSSLYCADRTNYTSSGLVQWFQNHGDGPSLRSNFYLQYGKVEIKCKTPKGTGIIANFFMQSDDGDEIDFEWMSSYPKQVTTNYFGKGVTGDYDRGTVKRYSSNLTDEYHTYTIDWKKDKTVWYVDGKAVRTLKASKVKDDGKHDYPVSPMRVFIGLWAGGDAESSLTVKWAGGKTTTEGAPFIFNVKSFAAVDYSTGSAYSYKDKTGEKIEAQDGTIYGNSKGSLPSTYLTPAFSYSSTSSVASASASASASKSTSTTADDNTAIQAGSPYVITTNVVLTITPPASGTSATLATASAISSSTLKTSVLLQ